MKRIKCEREGEDFFYFYDLLGGATLYLCIFMKEIHSLEILLLGGVSIKLGILY